MPKCPLEKISREEIRWLTRYWMTKRGDRRFPRREDMVPEDLSNLWPHMLIVERPDGEYRYRLMGTELVERYGQDLTGKLVSAAGLGVSEAYWISIYDEMFAKGEPLYGIDSLYWQDREYVKFEWGGVPLSSDGKTVNQLMGCIISI